MAWISPLTFVAGQAPSASQLNAMLYSNMMETEAALADGISKIFVSEGRNKIAMRQIEINYGNPTGSLSSTSYITHSTMPAITVTTGAAALILWSAVITSGSGSYTDYTAISIEVSGNTTIAATDSYAIMTHQGGNAPGNIDGLMMAHYFNNLTPGTNTFQMKGRVTSGSSGISQCTIVGFPF